MSAGINQLIPDSSYSILFAVIVQVNDVFNLLSIRDVLPFTLEMPEAIAKASSHKQLESISHMGVGKYMDGFTVDCGHPSPLKSGKSVSKYRLSLL